MNIDVHNLEIYPQYVENSFMFANSCASISTISIQFVVYPLHDAY
jgi:hypothetical protein